MESTWELIKDIVIAARLNEEEQQNVLSALDRMLGTNLLEYKYPISQGSLTENEFLIYRDIVSALNERRSFGRVRNDFQYDKAVSEIFDAVDGKPSKELKKKLVDMDKAYHDEDWDGVNKILNSIGSML